MVDFTLNMYSELLKVINYNDCTIRSYLINNHPIILRHDVDRSLNNALKMAKLEAKYNLSSTYYFRVHKTFDIYTINKIAKLGHEIGYHYECLDKAKGNVKKALNIFKKELSLFKKWGVKTICMHGNPLSRWDNRDMWKENKFKDFGVLGEAYLSIDFNKMPYFTDTGRSWNSNFAVKDRTGKGLQKINGTEDLINKIKLKKIKKAYILTHPCRWNDNYVMWLKELLWQNVKNIGKRLLK